ncbi:MAG: ParB/RepB/Spo0J family partition protein [bacterium]
MATRRLGKGLSALIPDIQEADPVRKDSLTEIAVSVISPNPFQPRSDFDNQALSELKKSISENGLITPITVRSLGNGYQLIAGERRLRAVQELGFATIPAYVLNVTSDEEMLELSLVENIQRENLNAIEEALGYKRLIEECDLTQEDAAKKVGKDRATIANFLRLLKLPEPVQESLRTKEISAGHARALLSCSKQDKLLQIWKKIKNDGLSVRQVEKLATQKKKTSSKTSAKNKQPDPHIQETEDKMRQIFGTQVRILRKGKGGAIEMEFYSENDLERIVELLLKLW